MLRTVGDRPSLWESMLPEACLGMPAELEAVGRLLDDSRLFELLEAGPLIAREARTGASVGLGPPHPLAQRLMVDRQLGRDRLDRLPLRRIVVLVIEHHPHRPLPHLRRIRRTPRSLL